MVAVRAVSLKELPTPRIRVLQGGGICAIFLKPTEELESDAPKSQLEAVSYDCSLDSIICGDDMRSDQRALAETKEDKSERDVEKT